MDLIFKTFPWAFPKAKKAFQEGYNVETIGICFNGINALLRLGFFQKAQLDEGKTEIGSYLTDLLMNYENELTGRCSDRSVYKEARKQSVITHELYATLNSLHEERNKVFHRLFDGMVIEEDEIDETKLHELAQKYLDAYIACQEVCKGLAQQQEKKGLLEKGFLKTI